jgi:hypothetical protein
MFVYKRKLGRFPRIRTRGRAVPGIGLSEPEGFEEPSAWEKGVETHPRGCGFGKSRMVRAWVISASPWS